MDRIRSIDTEQTKLRTKHSWSSISIHRTLFWTRASDSHSNTKNDHHKFSHRHNKYIPAISTLVLSLLSPTASLAADVGGVSATANPIANSSGSVTNQAIQVLQGPYITNTYGGGIQCKGATMNITPYVTGSGAFQRPFESYYDDPVYDVHDADDDGQIDNPGNILYTMPTRTNQTDNYNLSIGVSATWSRPLDKELQELCKAAATTQMEALRQSTANKRLDFEIARLKNCGELMQKGIVFHPQSPYAAVCADVMLVNPPGVVGQHTHSITSSSVSEQDLNLSSSDTHSPQSQNESDDTETSQGWRWPWSKPALSQDETPVEEDQPAALLGGPMHLPPSQSQP